MANRFSMLSLEDETGESIVLAPRARPARRREVEPRAAGGRDGGSDDDAAGSDDDAAGESLDEAGSGDDGARAPRASSPSTPSARASAPAKAESGTSSARRPRPFGGGSMLWLDLEMTGLNAQTDHILELACVISDGNLTRFVDGPELVISQSAEVLAGMNAWCQQQHGDSGLVARVQASALSLREAELQVIAFLEANSASGVLNLAGNAIYKDAQFLEVHMPELMAMLSWRVVDVSTLNELAHRWFPNALRKMPRKKGKHRARADIYESIEELKCVSSRGAGARRAAGRVRAVESDVCSRRVLCVDLIHPCARSPPLAPPPVSLCSVGPGTTGKRSLRRLPRLARRGDDLRGPSVDTDISTWSQGVRRRRFLGALLTA